MEHSNDANPNFQATVDALLRASFKTGAEADLVSALRQNGDMAAEIVFSDESTLIGYAGVSKMTAPAGWYCLAPVAISPAAQGSGNGAKLMAMVEKWGVDKGATIVVLGNRDFYRKCGFSSERAANLTSPYPVKYTLLAGPGQDAPAETLVYPPAFAALD